MCALLCVMLNISRKLFYLILRRMIFIFTYISEKFSKKAQRGQITGTGLRSTKWQSHNTIGSILNP